MKKIYLLFILTGIFSLSLTAQENLANYKLPKSNEDLTFVWGSSDRDTAVVRVLLENSPRYFNAPGMPRFSVIGKDRKFYLGIGGYVKGTVSYDWRNPITNSAHFTTSEIPMNQAPGNGGLVQFGASTSTIAINFVALPGTKNQIGSYINLDFSSPGNGLFLMNAYGTYRGFKAGIAFSLFTDLMAGPPTIDFEGPCGWTLIPNAVVDYEHKFGKHWGVGVGAEMPIASYTTDSVTAIVNQQIPDFPVYVQYSWNKGNGWLRFSAIMRNMLYRDLVTNENFNNVGWGIKLSGSSTITKKLTAFYQGAYGMGISSYFQDIYGMNLDMVPHKSVAGELSNVEAYGGYVGLQYNFTKTTFASCTYSLVHNYAKDHYFQADQYESAQYLVVNLFWNLAPNVQMGVEYLYGDRMNEDKNLKVDNRIQTMLQVNF